MTTLKRNKKLTKCNRIHRGEKLEKWFKEMEENEYREKNNILAILANDLSNWRIIGNTEVAIIKLVDKLYEITKE